jgi:arginyl-tRNA synthetase
MALYQALESMQTVHGLNHLPTTQVLVQRLEAPKDPRHGDWAFPCFQLKPFWAGNPAQQATLLAERIQQDQGTAGVFSEVKALGPFLNFRVDPKRLSQDVLALCRSGALTARRAATGIKVMVEYSQPNTHKAFHVGHMRNVALGDALARLLKWQGHEVVAANYIGDVGTHIAKCLWFFSKHFSGDIPQKRRGEFLGTLYTQATHLLDFKNLSQVPMAKVVCVQVREKEPLGAMGNVHRVVIDDGTDQFTVLCGGTGYGVADRVAWAKPGARLGGREVQVAEKQGVVSHGMLCSLKELGMGEDKNQLLLLSEEAPLGVALSEWFRTEDSKALPGTVDELMAARSSEVSEVLRLLEEKDPEMTALWRETRAWSMADFDEIYQWLDAHFDHCFFESDVGDEGKALVKALYEQGVLVASEGALGADLSDVGLPFCLLLKSDGTGLYATKDLALAKRKFEQFGIDQSIYVVDASQSLHFQQVFAVLKKMGFAQANQCHHLAYGMVVRREGRMASRSGNVILFSELQETLSQKIYGDFLQKYEGLWPQEEIEEATRRIAVATIRYGMLNNDQVKDTVFDLEEWSSRSGNTGPYLLYAAARIAKIFRDAPEMVDLQATDEGFGSLLTSEEEQELLRSLSQFPGTVASAAEQTRPQLLCIYLYDLARSFSRFYDRCPILKDVSAPLQRERLALTNACGQVLTTGLSLLGIKTLDRM